MPIDQLRRVQQSCQTARRGGAEDLDVGPLAGASLLANVSRCATKNGETLHEFVDAISHAIDDADASSLRTRYR
jgi:hypothetical protein